MKVGDDDGLWGILDGSSGEKWLDFGYIWKVNFNVKRMC